VRIKKSLSLADQLLIKNSQKLSSELSTLIDLKKKRKLENIFSTSWGCYVDILANLPQLFPTF